MTDALGSIALENVAGVEVFRGVSEMPSEFADPDIRCGAVAVWTRSWVSDGTRCCDAGSAYELEHFRQFFAASISRGTPDGPSASRSRRRAA